MLMGVLLVGSWGATEGRAEAPGHEERAPVDHSGDDPAATGLEMRLGIKLGAARAMVIAGSRHNDDDVGTRRGRVVGASLQVRVHHNAFLQVELLHVEKGGLGPDEGYASAQYLDYFEVPLLAGFEMGSGPERAYFLVGPYVARRHQERAVTDPAAEARELSMEPARLEPISAGGRLADLDYGAIFSLGAAVERRPPGSGSVSAKSAASPASTLTFEGRFGLGLADLTPDNGRLTAHHVSLQLLLGYYF